MRGAVIACAVALGGACGETAEAPADAGPDAPADATEDSYAWKLPEGFPVPKVPADNPMTEEKVKLGRRLFYDKRLSLNQTQSCGTCHQQALAFTDGKANAVGSTGEVHRRSAMSLVNVAYYSAQTWANPTQTTLEKQAAVPMFGISPVELGMAGHEQDMLDRLRAEPLYPAMFAAAFPADRDPFTVSNVLRAIASFERTIVSGSSPFDRYMNGDDAAISASAARGAALFLSERLECRHCHGTFAFTGSVTWRGKSVDDLSYQNNALYNIDGAGAYPLRDRGLYEVTLEAADMGKFRPPTLRNVAVTAPYMHDGTIATLRDVIVNHYARGGRLVTGPDAGDGARSPLRASFVSGFAISEAEVDDVIAFLESLTDATLLGDAALSDPWAAEVREAP